MENQNRIQTTFNKQVDNQEYPNSQLADNITNIQQFENKPLECGLQLNTIHNDISPLELQKITNPCIEDYLNPLQSFYEACNDNNQEIFLEFSNKDFIDKLDFLDDVHLQETNSTPYSNFNENQIKKKQINEPTNNVIPNHMIDLDKEGFQDVCEFLEEQKAYDFLEDQSNHLKREHEKCGTSNEEMTPHKKFKSIQEESSDDSVDETIASSQVQKPNEIIRLNIHKYTKLENLEEVLQIYKKNEVFNSFITNLNNFVNELISLTTKELDKYELKAISIDDAIEKLKYFSSLNNKKRYKLYCSLYENKNTFDFYSTLSRDNKVSRYIYCLFTILEDIEGGDLQKYFQGQELILISNKILSIINQFFNEDTCDMYSKRVELKKLLWQAPNINNYTAIIDRSVLEKYSMFFSSIYRTSIYNLYRSIHRYKQKEANDLQTIQNINCRKFDIKTYIIYCRESKMHDHLIDNLHNFTNQIVIEMKKEIFTSEGQCLYKDININSVIEEIKTINAINKANKELTSEAQYRKIRSLAKENPKEKNFYTIFNPRNRILNLISVLFGIIEIIDNLDKKIPEDKAALEEILENSKTLLHYFFDLGSLINEKIIELKRLLFQISFVQKNRSIFDLDCIKQHEKLVACIYEMSINSVQIAIKRAHAKK